MSDPAPPAKRPKVVASLYTYCVVVILLGLIALAAGASLLASADFFGMNSMDAYLWGGMLTVIGIVLPVFHAVPFFLKREETTWRVLQGFLIAYIVIWGLVFWPFCIPAALLLSKWSRPAVKEYYGVAVVRGREYYVDPRRGADWDDGWDENWDPPRR